MRRILQDVRVLDLTQFFSGPQATLFLAGLGAEVIRVDSPASAASIAKAPPYAGRNGVSLEPTDPDDLSVSFLKRARGKKAICLDLKQQAGVDLFHRLVKQSDVVVENYSVGVADRLGIGYEALAAINPRLIYCALTGYGSTGPDAHLKAYDVTVQAAAGLMSLTGNPGEPPLKAGTALSDAIAGTFAMSGIVAALYDREKTGKGQFIDVSMVDCLFALIFDDPIDWYDRLGVPTRQGNRIMRFSPMNTYKCADGWAVMGAATPPQWQGFLRAIERTDLAEDPDWARVEWRVANNDAVDAAVLAWSLHQPADKAVDRMRTEGAIAAPIHDAASLAGWPQLQARGMYETLQHPTLGALDGVGAPGFPLKFSEAATGYDSPSALARTHNREVLSGVLGLDADEIDALEKALVI
ncbi:MAG: CaiB/BaiF CoA transferase family protein [Alphaproteobacteria bacterium]